MRSLALASLMIVACGPDLAAVEPRPEAAPPRVQLAPLDTGGAVLWGEDIGEPFEVPPLLFGLADDAFPAWEALPVSNGAVYVGEYELHEGENGCAIYSLGARTLTEPASCLQLEPFEQVQKGPGDWVVQLVSHEGTLEWRFSRYSPETGQRVVATLWNPDETAHYEWTGDGALRLTTMCEPDLDQPPGAVACPGYGSDDDPPAPGPLRTLEFR